MEYTRLGFKCLTCDKKAFIQQVFISADYKLVFQGYCIKCKQKLCAEFLFEFLTQLATGLTSEPKLLAAAQSAGLTEFTSQDESWLLKAHILPPDSPPKS